MENRPKIKPTPKPLDKGLEILTWGSLAILWGLYIYAITILPETIPIHFNASGEPDGYGSKTTIFTLPIIASLLFLLLSVVSKFPHKFNYSVKITMENAPLQYANALRMLRFLKLSVNFIFLLISIQTIRTAIGEAEGLGGWFILVVLGLIVGPLVYFISKSYQLEK